MTLFDEVTLRVSFGTHVDHDATCELHAAEIERVSRAHKGSTSSIQCMTERSSAWAKTGLRPTSPLSSSRVSITSIVNQSRASFSPSSLLSFCFSVPRSGQNVHPMSRTIHRLHLVDFALGENGMYSNERSELRPGRTILTWA